MKTTEFERMLCDSLKDIQDGKFPDDLMESVHYVNTLERLELEPSNGVKLILNDGSIFILLINRPQKCGQ